MIPPEPMDPIELKYVEALAKLPPFKCGRLDMNTYMPEAVQAGRVVSDVVRYIYFQDGTEAIVLGQRADYVAYAASKYHALTAEIENLRSRLSAVQAETLEEAARIVCDMCNEGMPLELVGDKGHWIHRSRNAPHFFWGDCRAASIQEALRSPLTPTAAPKEP